MRAHHEQRASNHFAVPAGAGSLLLSHAIRASAPLWKVWAKRIPVLAGHGEFEVRANLGSTAVGDMALT